MTYKTLKINQETLTALMLIEAKKEGWNYSKEDVDFYYHCSGNHIYAVENDGRIIGCIILHERSNLFQKMSIYSVGLFLVNREYRGLGVGSYLFNVILTEYVPKDSLVFLNAVPLLTSFYARHGFFDTNIQNKHYSLRQGDYIHSSVVDMAQVDYPHSVKLSDVTAENLKAFMNKIFSENTFFIELLLEWVCREDAKLVIAHVSEMVVGYGVATICHRNAAFGTIQYRIAPLYADNEDIAEFLLRKLLVDIFTNNTQEVELNTPQEVNVRFVDGLKSFGFITSQESNTALMATQNCAVKKVDEVYSLMSLEFPHEYGMRKYLS